MRKCKQSVLFIVMLAIGAVTCGVRASTAEPPSTVVTTNLDVTDPDDGVISLREAILHSLADPTLGRHITFDLNAGTSSTIILLAPLPVMNSDTLSIDGSIAKYA